MNQKFKPHEIEWDQEKTIQLWNYYSNSKPHIGKYFGRQSGKEVASILNKKIFKKVSSILDFSCGKGDLLEACLPYIKTGQTLHATDISVTSIEETSRKLQNHAVFSGSTLIKEFPSSLKNNSFDLVIATEVIEHLNDNELNAIIREIYRITKPNGFIFITTPYQENLEIEKTICPECGCIFHRWQHLRSWSIESLTSTIESYQFKTIECKNIQWGPPILKLYFKLIGKTGNGIYYIGQKYIPNN